MHKDVYWTKNVTKPNGRIFLVYFSSATGNTKRFVEKIGCDNTRIPIDPEVKTIEVKRDYVIICPTYSGGGEFTKGAVPKQVVKFLNVEKNRAHCRGVIATGNTNFNNTFGLAGLVISKKLNVPILYQLELSGTKNDVQNAKEILRNFWKQSLNNV